MKCCSIEGCEKPAGKRRGWCVMHYARWKRHGNPLVTKRPTYAPRTSDTCTAEGCDMPHMARGRTGTTDRAPLTYTGAHGQVRRARGRAHDHRCEHCTDSATTWAYDHADPNEMVQGHGLNAGMSYSLDVTHYLPLCRPCHEAFDAEYRKKVA